MTATRKPRLILMGEFSSGKSTLSNILLGVPTLPTQVTATRLPPVHISHGDPSARAVGRDGRVFDVDPSDLSGLSPDEVQALHITMISDTLELCDLIDMPGISDPNMPADTWDTVAGPADHVIWCTHATQAWRQSEAAMWDRMREATSGRNLLLVTQVDKLRNSRDRARVLSRIEMETEGKFTAIYPVSLLEALKAGEDFEAWKASGANAFMEHLVEILLTPTPPRAAQAEEELAMLSADEEYGAPQGGEVIAWPGASGEEGASHIGRGEIRVRPRRVQARPGGSSEARLPRDTRVEDLALPMEPGAL